MNDQQRTELYLYIRTNEADRKEVAYSESDWQRGYHAGYSTAMGTVLNILNLQDDFKKWSEKNAKK